MNRREKRINNNALMFSIVENLSECDDAIGLDKTHKKEKKDRRFAQFNLILGAAADAGKREFNFTTRDKTTTHP